MQNFLHIVPLSAAKERGLRTYFTGKPCPLGSIDLRLTSQKRCVCELCREKNTQRCLGRHKENRQQALLQMRAYYERNRAQHKGRVAQYREKNRVEINAALRDARKANPEKWREKDRRNALRNKAARKARNQRWQKENAHVCREHNSRRRAAKRERLPVWFGELDIFVMREAASLCKARHAATGLEWHVDHMLPLRARRVSGLHCAANLQVIPAALNIAKGNKRVADEPDAWLALLR